MPECVWSENCGGSTPLCLIKTVIDRDEMVYCDDAENCERFKEASHAND